jgi:phosphoglycolate phosphatase-like HAD superfamily hydrolase
VAIDRAMKRVHGVDESSRGVRFAGGTDRAIARALLAKAAIVADDDSITRLLEAYVVELADVLATRSYRPVGDVHGVVAQLRARGASVGIGTGNVREGAALKLKSAGLLDLFDLARGGYGSDAEARDEVLRIALARTGGVSAGPVVVVGDTEHDVSAGRAIGARVVGVAIRSDARAELAAAGADAIVETCGDALLRAIFGE